MATPEDLRMYALDSAIQSFRGVERVTTTDILERAKKFVAFLEDEAE